jgi:hypothetical protein
MTKYSYYADELTKLQDSEFYKTLVISDGIGNATKHLGVNLESIKILQKWLKHEAKRLKVTCKGASK